MEAGLEEEIAYTEELLQALEEEIKACGNRKIQDLFSEMKELLADEKIRDIRSKDDKDARFGHKTPTSTFYGYKNHLAMTEKGIKRSPWITQSGFERVICHGTANVFHSICGKYQEDYEADGAGYAVRGIFSLHALE